MTQTEQGQANHHRRARQRIPRPLLVCACRRVRLLPEGGDLEPLKRTGLQQYLAATLQHADTQHHQVRLAPDARELWWHAYPSCWNALGSTETLFVGRVSKYIKLVWMI